MQTFDNEHKGDEYQQFDDEYDEYEIDDEYERDEIEQVFLYRNEVINKMD